MEMERRGRDIIREFKSLMQQNKLFPSTLYSAQSERFGPDYEGKLTSKEPFSPKSNTSSQPGFSETATTGGGSPRKSLQSDASGFMREEDLDSYFIFMNLYKSQESGFSTLLVSKDKLKEYLDSFLLALKEAQIRQNFLQTRAAQQQ